MIAHALSERRSNALLQRLLPLVILSVAYLVALGAQGFANEIKGRFERAPHQDNLDVSLEFDKPGPNLPMQMVTVRISERVEGACADAPSPSSNGATPFAQTSCEILALTGNDAMVFDLFKYIGKAEADATLSAVDGRYRDFQFIIQYQSAERLKVTVYRMVSGQRDGPGWVSQFRLASTDKDAVASEKSPISGLDPVGFWRWVERADGSGLTFELKIDSVENGVLNGVAQFSNETTGVATSTISDEALRGTEELTRKMETAYRNSVRLQQDGDRPNSYHGEIHVRPEVFLFDADLEHVSSDRIRVTMLGRTQKSDPTPFYLSRFDGPLSTPPVLEDSIPKPWVAVDADGNVIAPPDTSEEDLLQCTMFYSMINDLGADAKWQGVVNHLFATTSAAPLADGQSPGGPFTDAQISGCAEALALARQMGIDMLSPDYGYDAVQAFMAGLNPCRQMSERIRTAMREAEITRQIEMALIMHERHYPENFEENARKCQSLLTALGID